MDGAGKEKSEAKTSPALSSANAKSSPISSFHRRKLVSIIAAIILSLAIIGLIIWLIVRSRPATETDPVLHEPESSEYDDSGFSTDIIRVQNSATDAYLQNDENTASATEVFDAAAASLADGKNLSELDSEQKSRVAELRLAEMMFYIDHNKFTDVLRLKNEVDSAALSDADQATFYNYIMLALTELNASEEEITKYADLSYDAGLRAYGQAQEGEQP